MDIIELYVKEARKKFRKLSREEENELILKAQQGDIQARNEVVERHLLLVLKLARHMGGDISDLIFEGNIALIHAVQHFDVNYGTRFITYAGKRIKNAYRNYIRKMQRKKDHAGLSLDNARYLKSPNGFTDIAIADAIIERAPIKEKEKFILRQGVRGFTSREIGEQLGLTRQAVHVAKTKALKKIEAHESD